MAWWHAAWSLVDTTLRGWSQAAQSIVAKVRFARNAVGVFIFALYALVAAAIIWPQYDQIFLGITIVLLSILIWVAFFLIGLPLRAKSIVRLIDTGYPENAKELALRVAARKLHEESIETEELLVETAWNEGRKAYHKYKAKAMQLKEELDRASAAAEADGPSAEPASDTDTSDKP